ncbi:hypothetical protein F0L74_09575 [Chitinophaga agrisoli]|uniref:Antitoxin component YwqK of YwqJK toxin-antitoxin module n=1 Tax=Chitinophaga agrisoli TaxID=2607653 RepID=A0A5B2VWY1_9BACT|nr:hypothetical protein [Chitinophaga agrisoli]KAA2242767.1 hypothetical protein F0L74_09575 [Chitinophaga agrisoli]
MRQYLRIVIIFISTGFISQTSQACVCSDILTIDSLAQLEEYSFIAHVKIIDDQILKEPTKDDHETIGQLSFKVLELFKGEKIDKILEYAKNSSCDIGVSKGEEWLLFGTIKNNKVSILPCDRNRRYKERDGRRDWKYGSGLQELDQLRKLYGHPIRKFVSEERKEFYKNGKIEIEESYVNGKLNGARKIWYPNGMLFCRQSYVNDTLDGKAAWFYETGQIYEDDYYERGKPLNASRIYYDSTIEKSWKKLLIEDFYKTEDSLNFVYKRVQAQYETIFDSYGRAIISREYTRLGKISREEIIDPEKKFRTVIYYHDNGVVSSIMYSLNGVEFGHYQTYEMDGSPGRGWDYDKEGKAILNK